MAVPAQTLNVNYDVWITRGTYRLARVQSWRLRTKDTGSGGEVSCICNVKRCVQLPKVLRKRNGRFATNVIAVHEKENIPTRRSRQGFAFCRGPNNDARSCQYSQSVFEDSSCEYGRQAKAQSYSSTTLLRHCALCNFLDHHLTYLLLYVRFLIGRKSKPVLFFM